MGDRLSWKRGVRALTFVLLSLMVLFSVPSFDVRADTEPLELQVQTWFGNHGKEGDMLPVSFTITNPGPRLEGDLAVQFTNQSQGEDAAIVTDLELPEGTSVQVWMAIPARYYNSDNNEIVFFHNGIEKGDRVDFAGGSKHLQVQIDAPQTMYMGVFAEGNEAYQFLNVLSQDQYELRINHFNAETFPKDSFMLESLDVLAMNNYSSDLLSDRQIEAVREWIKDGGRLILSGGAGYSKTASPFSDISPVEVIGTTTLNEFPALERISSRELQIQAPVTIARAELTKGKSLLTQDEMVLFAESNYGLGTVWFTAYDIALEPLASWSGNPQLWSYLLNDQLNTVQSFYGSRGDLWEMSSALDFFPSLEPPSIGLLSLVFMLYMIIVAPVLYFILKKVDKRGWLWWAVPVTAVVFGAAIYGVGAAERNTTLVQQLSIVEMHGDGTGQKTSAASFFVPQGGKYEVKPRNNEWLTPFWPRYSYDNGVQLSKMTEWYYTPETGSAAVFTDVPFWSIRKLWMEAQHVTDYGSLDVAFTADESGWQGELTNHTDLDWEDVHVLYGQSTLTVGDLKAGQTEQFQLNNSSAGSRSHYRNMADLVFPYYGSSNENRHKRALLHTALAMQGNEIRDPIVIGVSKQNVESFAIDGELVDTEEMILWVQRAEINLVQGDKVFIPQGYIQPDIRDNQLDYIDFQTGHGAIYIGTGTLELNYGLPQIDHAEYDEFTLWLPDNQGVTLRIWNQTTESWEPIDQQASQLSFTDVEAYLIEHSIRLKVASDTGHAEFYYPQISLRGGQEP